jgi:DNA-binding IscR family transcriptional regulator
MSVKSVQFAVAAHIMAALGYFHGEEISSAILADSVNADPTFVRKSLSKLSKAGVVRENSSRDPRRGGSWWSRQAIIGSIEQEDSGGGQPACAWRAHI